MVIINVYIHSNIQKYFFNGTNGLTMIFTVIFAGRWLYSEDTEL